MTCGDIKFHAVAKLKESRTVLIRRFIQRVEGSSCIVTSMFPARRTHKRAAGIYYMQHSYIDLQLAHLARI